MSSIHWFVDEQYADTVPLGADFLAQGGLPNTESQVAEVRITATGALVICKLFKGMVFRSRPEFAFMVEALELYCVQSDVCCPLVARVRANGYLLLGADFVNVEAGCWIKDGSVYRFRSNELSAKQETRNPFLPEMAEKPPETGVLAQDKAKQVKAQRKNPLIPGQEAQEGQ